MTLSPEREQQIRADVEAATVCPEAASNGRDDNEHTWGGSSFTHVSCELCRFARPRGQRTEETAELLAELDRVRAERNRLSSGVLHFAAEAHRRKWAHDAGEDRHGNPISAPAFDELHRIGNELRALWDKCRTAERTRVPAAVPAAGEPQ